MEIPVHLQDLYKVNFGTLFRDTKQKLHEMSRRSYNWMDRINIIKTFITPKFLFLFRMLPIFIPNTDFHPWQKWFNDFLWANKHHRIPFRILRQTSKRGGLGIPDLKTYYEAANLTNVTRMTEHHNLDWLTIETGTIKHMMSYGLL